MASWIWKTLLAVVAVVGLFLLAFFQIWEIFGVAASLVAMVILLVFSFWLYFRVRKKYAHAKFMVEALFIGGAILFSIFVKMVVFCVLEQTNDFLSGFNSCIKAIYSGIGGLTFEGLQDFELDGPVNRLMQSFYFFSSLYAGAMTLFIISAKASYEFYTALRLVLGNERNKNVYVITAVTEETLYLAKDIKQSDNQAVIVFASSTMQPFDGQDELCRQVMANGFLYWSYAKNLNKNKKTNRQKTKSIARVLFLNNANGGAFNKRNYNRRFVVYAFASQDHIPSEEENLDVVFDDIFARIERPDNLRVEYFLLTKREINFQAYSYRNREMMLEYAAARNVSVEEETPDGKQNLLFYQPFREYFLTQTTKGPLPKSWKKFAAKISQEYSTAFVLNIWCEALTIGRQTLHTMMQHGFDKYLAQTDAGLRVWALGFGTTGQAITNELFVQSAGVDANGRTRDFMLDVFDQDALDLGGMFKTNHSTYYYLYDEFVENNPVWSQLTQTLEEVVEGYMKKHPEEAVAQWPELCRKYLATTALPLHLRNAQAEQQHLHPEIPMPIYRFHAVSCTELEFFNRIDKATGKEANSRETELAVKKMLELLSKSASADENANLLMNVLKNAMEATMPEPPQVIVISTGDDYRNIRIANALIQDIACENADGAKSQQFIIVNVWDKHNNPLLINSNGLWNDEHDILTSEGLTVIVVGNNNNIYTYSSTVQQTNEEEYNFTYSGMCDWLYNPILKTDESKNATQEASKLADILSRLLKFPDGTGVDASAEEVAQSTDFLLDCKDYVYLLHKMLRQNLPADVNQDSFAGEMFQKLFNGDVHLPAQSYAALDIWARESNKSATLFAPVHYQTYLHLAEQDADDTIQLYSRLTVMEHCRWVRMHVANGWTYNAVRRNSLRHHDCILPFVQLRDDVILYDTLNVFWAIVSQQNNK